MTNPPAGPGAPPAGTIYQLRIVVAGISPLIWRRLEVPAGITVAGLHAIVQTIFGWSDEHLHRFTIAGAEYGIWHEGGPGFRDDARQVRLAGLGLRERERFSYEYNFSAAWRVDLRVEQITGAQPERAYPRCTGGRRAGPPEHWAGPWDYLERSQPYRVFDATVRAAEIIGQLTGQASVTAARSCSLSGRCWAWNASTGAPATAPCATWPWAPAPYSLRGTDDEGQRAGARAPRRRHPGRVRGAGGARP